MRQLARKKTAPKTAKGGMEKEDAKPALMDQQKLEEKLSRPVSSLKLTGLYGPIAMRALNYLGKKRIKTLGDLVKKSEDELSQFKYFGGEKTMKALKRSLKRLGLELGMEMPKPKNAAATKKKAAPKKGQVKKPEAKPKKAAEKKAPQPKEQTAPKETPAAQKPARPEAEEKPVVGKGTEKPNVRDGVTVEVEMGLYALEHLVGGAKGELDNLLKTVRPELVKRLEQVVELFKFPKRPPGGGERTGEANPGISM
jgi:hypothetical protein